MAAKDPAPAQIDVINGSTVSISGKLVESDDRWVTLQEDDHSETMIARDAITSVTVRIEGAESMGTAVPNR